MITEKQVKEGLRVRLLPFEDQPEQKGTVLSNRAVNGTAIIDLDKEFRDNEFDDGIRECGLDQLEVLT